MFTCQIRLYTSPKTNYRNCDRQLNKLYFRFGEIELWWIKIIFNKSQFILEVFKFIFKHRKKERRLEGIVN